MEPLFIVACVLAGIVSSPQEWAVFLGLLATIGLAVLLRGRVETLSQVLFCLVCMPIWVSSVTAWFGWSWLLGVCALGLFVLAWPDRNQRRVGLLLLALGSFEAVRLAGLGGPAGFALAGGIFLYGLMGAGIWAGCSRPRAALRGSIVILLVYGSRLLWVMIQGQEAPLMDRAAWGLDFEDRVISAPEEGLALIEEGYQTPALVQALRNHYSVEELMESGLVARVDQLGVGDVVLAARWMERAGRGGEALRLLLQVTDQESCWWATLFSRTQAQEDPECVSRTPTEVLVPGNEAQEVDWPDPAMVQLQIDMSLSEEVRHLEFRTNPQGSPSLVSLDHGIWQELVPGEDGWVQVLGPMAAGPHRLQLQPVSAGGHVELSIRIP
jgi:hypothetical protein